jgi:HK97 gp10 family phage protein
MTLEGMDALKRAITESPKELKRLSSDAVRQSTWAIADKMRRRVPVNEGTLLGAIEAKVPVQTGLTANVTINGDAFYWRFLEYGTVKMAARPFARPAAEEESNAYIGRFTDVGRKLEQFWGKR